MTCSSRYWYYLSTPILYRNSTLTTTKSIGLFKSTIQRNIKSEKISLVEKLTFWPSKNDSLLDSNKEEIDIESVSKAHSCLFKMLVYHRNDTQYPVPSPFFFDISRILLNLEHLEETGISVVSRPLFNGDLGASPDKNLGDWRYTSEILTSLLKSCKKWNTEFPELKGLCHEPELCFEICVYLVESFESELRPLWHTLGSNVLRSSRRPIISKCKHFLSNLSNGMLLEARFITASAQRILDSFCLIYYAAIGISQSLDIEDLISCMSKNNENSGNKEDKTNNTSSLKSAIHDEKLNDEILSSQSAAIEVYEGIAILFNLPFPPGNFSRSEVVSFIIHELENVTLVFPPPGINDETIELLNATTFIELNPDDLFYSTVHNWIRWFKITIRWYK